MEKSPPAGIRPPLRVERIRLADIIKYENPRTEFDPEKIARLGESIRDHGQLQPLLVVEIPDQPGKVRLVCGEMRFRGMIHVGISEAECRYLERMPDPAQLTACSSSLRMCAGRTSSPLSWPTPSSS